MILIKPLQSPPSVATLLESCDKIRVADITGNWNWKHDGKHKNGDLIIHQNGTVAHKCGWTGGRWRHQADGTFWIDFNGIKHQMALTEDKQHLVLLQPFRNPPSVASLESRLSPEQVEQAQAER